jgi:hypothetical protein
MNKKLKPIAGFGGHAEQRGFWESHDSRVYVDWTKAKPVSLPDLKMSGTAPRPAQGLPDRSKVVLGNPDAPGQALVKVRPAQRSDAG